MENLMEPVIQKMKRKMYELGIEEVETLTLDSGRVVIPVQSFTGDPLDVIARCCQKQNISSLKHQENLLEYMEWERQFNRKMPKMSLQFVQDGKYLKFQSDAHFYSLFEEKDLDFYQVRGKEGMFEVLRREMSPAELKKVEVKMLFAKNENELLATILRDVERHKRFRLISTIQWIEAILCPVMEKFKVEVEEIFLANYKKESE